MMRIGLCGGMGSGKSTVAALLRERGAHLIDADAIARDIVQPGSAALLEIGARFGPRVLLADGSLDRAALARIAFSDAQALQDLEAITHPRIRPRQPSPDEPTPEDYPRGRRATKKAPKGLVRRASCFVTCSKSSSTPSHCHEGPCGRA